MSRYHNCCTLILLIGIIVSLPSTACASLKLEQVLKVYPEVAQSLPSKEASLHQREKPEPINIGEHTYQLRFFMFQVPEPMLAMQNVPFGRWAQAQGLLTTKSSQETQGFGRFVYFKASQELESKGIFYVLSLGPVGDAPLDVSLADVLQQAPQIAEFVPSDYVFGSKDIFVREIADHKYELRHFVYWVDPQKSNLHRAFFKDVCLTCNLKQVEARDVDHGYGTLKVFSQSDEMKKQGIYFTLALRRVT